MLSGLPVSSRRLCLAVIFLTWFPTARVAAQAGATAVSVTNFPIRFEPNVGQVAPPTRFIARDTNTELRLRPGGFDLSSNGGGEHSTASFAFMDALPETTITGDGRESSQTNYLIGSDPSRWLTHVPNYAQIKYSNLYPYIDLIFHGNGEHLEHDFIVSPGGNVSAIRMRLTSAGQLVRNPDGSIKISAPTGDLLLTNPSIYQIGNGGREPRNGKFVIKADNEIGFAIGKYDRARPLIIDPVLVFSTFLSPTSVVVSAVAADALGNTYVTGMGFSSSSPAATPNAFQTTCNSCNNSTSDVFVMKLTADGSGLIYSTFLGGSSYDQPNAIAVDANGNAIVAGNTQSTNFPVKSPIAFQPGGFGSNFGFISSLSADGSSLNYSSLLSNAVQQTPSSGTSVISIALDASGDAYVTGGTNAPTFPVTSGAFHNFAPAYPYNVAFVSKFLVNGSLGYSALIGDVSPQGPALGPSVTRIALDSLDNAILLGTGDAFFPTTTGAYQTTIPSPSTSAPFVAKLSADGSQLLYSTFVGPASTPTGLAIDATGDAFLTGRVNTSFPLTPNAYQKTFPGICCASYLAELDSTGSQLLYGTYFSGSGVVAGFPPDDALTNTLRLDSNQNIWLAGITTDAGFPLVHPIQSTLSTSAFTGFLSEFDPTGTTLLFSTYFGSFSEGSQSIDLAIDSNGEEHIVGAAGPDLYISPGAYLNSVTPPPPNTMSNYGFAAVIDTSGSSPSVCLGANAGGLPFGPVVVGSSRTEVVTITNCGTSSLTISTIASSSSAYTVPVSGNNCLSSVPANATCTFGVVFAPTAAGNFFANLKISANTPIPQTIMGLFGDGTVPIIQLNTTLITFDPLFAGQTVSTRAVFIQNVGTAPLVIDPAHTTATPNPTFTWQNECTQHVNPRQSCILPLTFTAPNSPGTVTGTLSIASNDPANPVVTVTLSGTAVNVYPVPAITLLDHPSVAKGSSISLGVSGQGFFPTSAILVNGIAQTTNYGGANFLNASVDASFFSSLGELTVTVSNPMPGGGVSNSLPMRVYISLAINPSALIYDQVTQLLYASIPAYAAANPNTIVPIDPTTGTTGTPIPVGNDPRRLAASDDDKYLYVALLGDKAIKRINLQTSTIERTFAFPPNQTVVSDMHVVPGASQSIVAAFDTVVALYSDGGLVNSVPAPGQTLGVTSFAFVGPNNIYALPFTTVQNHYFNVLTLNSQGLQFTPITGTNFGPDSETGAEVLSDGNLLYTSAGEIWNPATQKLVGTFPVSTYNKTSSPNMFNTAVDSALGQIFVIGEQNYARSSIAAVLSAYSVQSLALTGSLAFPQVLDPFIGNLVRWGIDGFAFIAAGPNLTDQELYILRSDIAAVQTAPSVFVDGPSQGANVSGIVTVSGWAINNAAAVGTAISSVQVKVDGTVVGTATYGLSRPDVCAVYPGRPGCPNVGYSYSLNTSSLSLGTHTITVTAADSDGTPDIGSATVTVTVQAPLPTVYIDAPAQGSAVSGTVTVSGWAVDNVSVVGTAISSVQVKVDGTVVGTATYGISRADVCAVYPGRPGCPNVGYSYSLNTSALSVGSHTIMVTATDSDGTPDTGSSSVTVNVQAPPPTVYIDAPAQGATVSGIVTVSGWALDNASTIGTAISSVQVKVDGSVVGTATYGSSRPDVCAAYPGRPGCPNVGYSYSLDTSTLNTGSHTITVIATDSDGTPDTGSASVNVTR